MAGDFLRPRRGIAMLFPVLSSLATLLVLATFALPVFALKLFDHGFNVVGALVGFAFYFCQYAVIVFFNGALVGAASIRREGGDPTFSDGIRIARGKLPAILGYAAIAATVGVAWTLATFLVVPVLVNRDIGPVDALKESVALLKKAWGENAIGHAGIGAAFGLIATFLVPAGIAATFLAWQAAPAAGITIAIVAVLALLVLATIQSALGGIYSAALYRLPSRARRRRRSAGWRWNRRSCRSAEALRQASNASSKHGPVPRGAGPCRSGQPDSSRPPSTRRICPVV